MSLARRPYESFYLGIHKLIMKSKIVNKILIPYGRSYLIYT